MRGSKQKEREGGEKKTEGSTKERRRRAWVKTWEIIIIFPSPSIFWFLGLSFDLFYLMAFMSE